MMQMFMGGAPPKQEGQPPILHLPDWGRGVEPCSMGGGRVFCPAGRGVSGLEPCGAHLPGLRPSAEAGPKPQAPSGTSRGAGAPAGRPQLSNFRRWSYVAQRPVRLATPQPRSLWIYMGNKYWIMGRSGWRREVYHHPMAARQS